MQGLGCAYVGGAAEGRMDWEGDVWFCFDDKFCWMKLMCSRKEKVKKQMLAWKLQLKRVYRLTISLKTKIVKEKSS